MNTPTSLPCTNGRFLKRFQFLETAPSPSPSEIAPPHLPQPGYGFYIGVSLSVWLIGIIVCLLVDSIMTCLGRYNRSLENCGSTRSKANDFSFHPVRVLQSNGASSLNDDCVVCLSEFSEGEAVRELPRCGHAFHKECLDKWLSSNCGAAALCPICRATVVEVNEDQHGRGTQQRDNGREEFGNATGVILNSLQPAIL